ncbi:MAG TPA: putative nucleotide-diphospho-sugar transferase [Rhabdochlamydiaceae bacterium]|nr:putative nucleotide-diphospho-sugar transferase [Rhabdochlamydiaceae bacterium]
MFPLIISFYTKETPYQLDAHHLMASCDQFGLEHHIEGIDSHGSWELNCAFKPFFIAQKLQQFKRPVLWVDADGVFARKPTPLKVFEKDFAVYAQAELPSNHPSKIRSGTIYVNATEKGMDVLKKWAQECQRLLINPERTEEFWDQIALRNVYLIEQKLGRLPLSYIKILGHPIDVKCPHPVIIHCQASRHAKKG